MARSAGETYYYRFYISWSSDRKDTVRMERAISWQAALRKILDKSRTDKEPLPTTIKPMGEPLLATEYDAAKKARQRAARISVLSRDPWYDPPKD